MEGLRRVATKLPIILISLHWKF